MKIMLQQSVILLRWTIALLLTAAVQQAWSQCNNVSQYPSTSIDLSGTNSTGATTVITTCNFSGEYSVLINAVGGNTYRFTSSIATDYFTIRSGSSGGPVVGSGTQPVSVTPGAGGTLYAHINSSSACLSDVSCRQTAVQCTSCAGGGCINGTIYPSTGISLNPTNTSGTQQQITTCQFSGEYYGVTAAIAGKSYTFSSGVGTDWITVRSGTFNGPIVVQGTTPVVVASATGADLFVHNNSNSSCGTNTTCRASNVQCTNCLCTNTTQFPSTGVSLTPTNTSGATQTITSCNFASDYAQLTSVISGNPYQFTSSVSTDYLTLHSGTFNGPVVAQGTTPLNYTAASAADLFLHINSNSSCGTNSSCRATTARCTNCLAVPACVSSPTAPTNGQTGICPSSSVTLSWTASSGATSYDVYFGIAATPPFVANVATTSYNAGALAAGTYYWQIRPRSAAGAASGCAIWSFIVADITAPVITCPANVSGNVNPVTACSAVMTYGAISANDNCTAPSIVLVSGLASGSTFPVGVNAVVYRATDGSGNSATCSFTVTVIDNQLPNITCPGNIAQANDLGKCNAVINYSAPTATDNCSFTVSVQSGQASGTAFPVGATVNVMRATDASGNTRTCSFTVTVNDTEKPKITCPNNISKSNDFSYCGANIPNLGPTAVSDNCNIGPLTNNSPVFFPIGTTAVTWTILDNHGNSATCQQTVTIADNEWPYITCPSTITQLTDEGNCNAVVNFAATATDNCAGTVIDYTADPLSTFEIGYTGITATATDAVGHFVSCNFLVQVKTRAEVCNGLDDDCDGITDDAEDWNQVIKTNVNSGGPSDLYGVDVDISGDWAVVGSSEKSGGMPVGAAYVMRRDAASPGGWKQVAKLISPNANSSDAFGVAVAVDSSGVIAVGAPEDDGATFNAGAVFVYQNTHAAPNTWTLVKKVVAGDPNSADEFGRSVALSLNRLLVGAALDDEKAVNAGAAYVFVQGQGGANNWGQVAKLMATDGAADDHLGASVDIHDIRALVGAPGNDEKGQDAGAAYLFSRNEGGPNLWGQTAKLLGKTEQGAGDHLGASVATSNLYALVGAPDNDLKGQDAGLVFAFSKNSGGNNKWKQWTYLSDYNASAGDHYGAGVGMDQEYAVVTATNDNPSGPNSGRGFIYLRLDEGWNQVDQINDIGGQTGDQFGSAAALSYRSAIVGVPHDQVGNDADQGSALIFEGNCSDGPRTGDEQLALSSGNFAVRCYPVPFAETLNIEVDAEAEDMTITVVNTLGQQVAELYRGAVHGVTNFHWLAGPHEPGMYFVQVSADGKMETKAALLEKP